MRRANNNTNKSICKALRRECKVNTRSGTNCAGVRLRRAWDDTCARTLGPQAGEAGGTRLRPRLGVAGILTS